MTQPLLRPPGDDLDRGRLAVQPSPQRRPDSGPVAVAPGGLHDDTAQVFLPSYPVRWIVPASTVRHATFRMDRARLRRAGEGNAVPQDAKGSVEADDSPVAAHVPAPIVGAANPIDRLDFRHAPARNPDPQQQVGCVPREIQAILIESRQAVSFPCGQARTLCYHRACARCNSRSMTTAASARHDRFPPLTRRWLARPALEPPPESRQQRGRLRPRQRLAGPKPQPLPAGQPLHQPLLQGQCPFTHRPGGDLTASGAAARSTR